MDRDRKDITTCPCCGQRVSVYSGIEGTCSYVGEELAEGRKQGLREAVSIMKRHPEGEGEWCDTGEDMEWACRSECVERAVKRIRAAIEKEGEI